MTPLPSENDPRPRGPKGAALPVVIVVLVVLGAVVGAGALVYRMNRGARNALEAGVTTPVRRGDLTIAVTESGTLQAEKMVRIRSRVPGSVQIIYIVPEGTRITEEDVRQGKVLVELDSSSLRDRLTRQQISVQNASAAYTKAKEDYAILVKQNESEIRKAALQVKFAWMELQHYVGEDLAQALPQMADLSNLSDHPRLGGVAAKEKARLESAVHLAQEELARAEDKVKWTRTLYEKKYVTGNELRADELAVEKTRADLDQARLALKLFLVYELPKEAEQRVADWRESVLEHERVKAAAAAEESQARVKLASAKATYELEKEELAKLEEQKRNCLIRAPQPGLVVYASSVNSWRRRNRPIEEGASVSERQEIIHLPDLTTMIARTTVHESRVNKVKPGQRAIITVDALPDLTLEGTVKTVADLPDPQHWLQDVKVFSTDIKVKGVHPGLRPGMSCRTSIIVAELKNVLYVPLQAVALRGERKVCYVATDKGVEMREVETGLFDDKVVEIKRGLKEGERVLLTPPVTPEGQEAAAAKEAPAAKTPSAAPKSPPSVAPSKAPSPRAKERPERRPPTKGKQPPRSPSSRSKYRGRRPSRTRRPTGTGEGPQ